MHGHPVAKFEIKIVGDYHAHPGVEHHKLVHHTFPRPAIKGHASEIFNFYDRDHNGLIPNKKAPKAVMHFYHHVGATAPHVDDVMHAIWQCDRNCDGKITLQNFKRILRILGGHAKKAYW
jgi:Ca2+-binding EF-hand superfamily protein